MILDDCSISILICFFIVYSSLQSPYYLANTNNTNHHLSNHSSSVQPGTNHNTLAKGAQPAVSMVGKGTL